VKITHYTHLVTLISRNEKITDGLFGAPEARWPATIITIKAVMPKNRPDPGRLEM